MQEETGGTSSSEKFYSDSSAFYPAEYDTTSGGQGHGPRANSSVGGDLKDLQPIWKCNEQ